MRCTCNASQSQDGGFLKDLFVVCPETWPGLTASFSVTCIAVIFLHPSFDMLKKQDGSKSINHSQLAWPFELVTYCHKSDMKQTPVCVLCDWLISNSTSKEDVDRWMSKDSRYARNTERGYKTLTSLTSRMASRSPMFLLWRVLTSVGQTIDLPVKKELNSSVAAWHLVWYKKK